ncbi:hypothetical protein [Nocardia jiangsuensis]|uniref:Acetyltransferase (GNAT) family protein n=1 Tax=Nocardia jiangsuensis TaxID=1691563 RepID=A0ABV8DLW9_9NOCA
MPQAVLHSDRLTLVPLAEEHLDYQIELDSDPEVMRYLGEGTARSLPQIEAAHRRDRRILDRARNCFATASRISD